MLSVDRAVAGDRSKARKERRRSRRTTSILRAHRSPRTPRIQLERDQAGTTERLGKGTSSASVLPHASSLALALRSFRLSLALSPPQTPNSTLDSSAKLRHSALTGHGKQIAFARRSASTRGTKKISGS